MCAGARTFGAQGAQKLAGCQRVQGRLARGHAETWQVCAGQGRNDMQRAGRRARVQGRLARGHAEDGQVSAVARTLSGSAPWQTQTRGKFLDVIARSEATWQSASLRQGIAKSSA